MSGQKGAVQNDALSQMLEHVLANPEIIKTVASALSSSTPTAEGNVNAVANDVAASTDAADVKKISTDEISDKLPQIMSMLRPMMSEGAKSGSSFGASSNKEALLCAVKPYLSGGRREAIDYIIKLSHLSEILKKMS